MTEISVMRSFLAAITHVFDVIQPNLVRESLGVVEGLPQTVEAFDAGFAKYAVRFREEIQKAISEFEQPLNRRDRAIWRSVKAEVLRAVNRRVSAHLTEVKGRMESAKERFSGAGRDFAALIEDIYS